MYDPIFWKDHFVEYARRYSMTQGESAGLVYLHPAPGEVEQQGTPQNAANFTHMDYGILEQAIMTNFLYVSTKHYAETLSEVKDYAYGVYEQSTGYTDKRIADLIGAPPETLDTIEKLADALKENEDVVNAINAAIVKKANQSVLETHMNNEYIHVDADKQEKWNGYEQQIADLNSNLSVIGELYPFTLGGSKKGFVKGENKLTVHTQLPAGRYLFTLNGTHESNAGEYGLYDVIFNPDDKNTRIYNGGVGTSLMSLSCVHDVSANCDINLLLYATGKYTTHSTWDIQAIRLK